MGHHILSPSLSTLYSKTNKHFISFRIVFLKESSMAYLVRIFVARLSRSLHRIVALSAMYFFALLLNCRSCQQCTIEFPHVQHYWILDDFLCLLIGCARGMPRRRGVAYCASDMHGMLQVATLGLTCIDCVGEVFQTMRSFCCQVFTRCRIYLVLRIKRELRIKEKLDGRASDRAS
jgi:hypothetical protein